MWFVNDRAAGDQPKIVWQKSSNQRYFFLVLSSSWNFPSWVEPSYKGSEPGFRRVSGGLLGAPSLTNHTVCYNCEGKFVSQLIHTTLLLVSPFLCVLLLHTFVSESATTYYGLLISTQNLKPCVLFFSEN